MGIKIKTLAAVLAGFLASATFAQTISDPTSEIRAMSMSEIDATMTAIAQQTTAAAPLATDAVTTTERAIYLKQTKTITYTVRLSEPITPAAAAKSTALGLCRGRIALALMERGVLYHYSVTTPAQTYGITFKRSDCPQ